MYTDIINETKQKIDDLLAVNKNDLIESGLLKMRVSLMGIDGILGFYGEENLLAQTSLLRLFAIVNAVSLQLKKNKLTGYVY